MAASTASHDLPAILHRVWEHPGSRFEVSDTDPTKARSLGTSASEVRMRIRLFGTESAGLLDGCDLFRQEATLGPPPQVTFLETLLPAQQQHQQHQQPEGSGAMLRAKQAWLGSSAAAGYGYSLGPAAFDKLYQR